MRVAARARGIHAVPADVILVVGWGAGAAAGGDVGVGGLAALEVAHVLVKAALDRRVLGLEHAQVPLAWPRPHSPTPTQLDAYE